MAVIQYSFSISDDAACLVSNLDVPSKGEINRFRAGRSGIEFLEYKTGIGRDEALRLCRKYLYGPVGTFIEKFDSFHLDKHVDSIDWTKLKYMGELQKAVLEKELKWEGRGKRTWTVKDGNELKFYTRKWMKKKRTCGLYIPECVSDAVERAIDSETHTFEGEFDTASLPVLKYILERSEELRNAYGDNWYPKFSDKEISNVCGFGMDDVRRATEDIVGVVGEAQYVDESKAPYRRVFLPSCRREIAETALRTERIISEDGKGKSRPLIIDMGDFQMTWLEAA
ncbi:MAG: hypothetical protein JXC85_03690 [Candidatus Aenigmarchaeota archaeon]|nr:hypothetical protein [Candidatus Aenigmarchaeota archaeon]